MKEEVFLTVLGFQVLVLVSQLTILLLRVSDRVRLYQLLVVIGYLIQHVIANLAFLNQDPTLEITVVSIIPVFLAICVATQSFQQFHLRIKLNSTATSFKLFWISAFVVVYLTPLFVRNTLIIATLQVLFVSACITIASKFLVTLRSQKTFSRFENILFINSIISTAILFCTPIIYIFSHSQLLYVLTIIISFVLTFTSNILSQTKQSANEYRVLRNAGFFDYERQELEKKLSAMEYKVALLLIKGLTHKEVADVLKIDVSTSRWHGTNIYRKLDCKGKLQEFRKRFGHLKRSLKEVDGVDVILTN